MAAPFSPRRLYSGDTPPALPPDRRADPFLDAHHNVSAPFNSGMHLGATVAEMHGIVFLIPYYSRFIYSQVFSGRPPLNVLALLNYGLHLGATVADMHLFFREERVGLSRESERRGHGGGSARYLFPIILYFILFIYIQVFYLGRNGTTMAGMHVFQFLFIPHLFKCQVFFQMPSPQCGGTFHIRNARNLGEEGPEWRVCQFFLLFAFHLKVFVPRVSLGVFSYNR